MQLKKHIHFYEKNKLIIIKKWISSSNVLKILNDCNIDKELFIKRYAFGVLDYYIDVIKEECQTNECSKIIDFLKYLKKHELKTNQLFILYSNFKNAFVQYLFELNIQNLELIEEVNCIFEDNFSYILETYTKTTKEVEKALSKSIDIVDKHIIMSRTDLKGNILKVSSAFCKISGYSNNELVSRSVTLLRHRDMPKEIFKDLWKTIKLGKIWHGEIKNRKKDGNFYWIETSIHPNFDNIGKIISYDAISQDISSKKELQSQQNIIVEQSKSAAMGEMISMIAHQWRQPLQAISLHIQKLSITRMIEEDISDELLEKVVDDVTSQLEYMSKTIDDFRDYFKPNRKKEKVSINDVIQKAVEFLGYIFRVDSINLNIINTQDYKTSIYLNEIVQVLINLIKNSRDAMIENNTQSRVLNISTYADSLNVYITIEDNAGGIPEKILGKIFEPYFSTKSNKNGTGLGLYMCKTIVEQHSDGKLSVKNTDIGAKFKIELPLE